MEWADECCDVDAVIWCTGYAPSLSHLSPLLSVDLDNPAELIAEGSRTRCAGVPVWLVGYGDWCGWGSGSIVGVQWTAEEAVSEVTAHVT